MIRNTKNNAVYADMEEAVAAMRHKLTTDPKWAVAAAKTLAAYQVENELKTKTTIYKNKVGFNKPDAPKAYRYLRGCDYVQEYRYELMQMMGKYSKQLVKHCIANGSFVVE